MIRAFTLVVMTLLISSCGASVDPLLQSKIADAFSKRSTQSYPAAGAFTKAQPFAVGQWVLLGSTSDGKRSILRSAIVGREQGGWIIESASTNESDESVSQALVTGLDEAATSHDIDKITIVWLKTRGKDGKVETIEGPALSLLQGTYRKSFGSFALSLLSMNEGGSVSVPAGTFAGTTKARSEVTVLFSTITSDGWFHPAVPISGMVKAQTTDGESLTELLDFGLSGAKPSF